MKLKKWTKHFLKRRKIYCDRMPGCGEYDNIDVIFIDDKNYNEKNIINNILYFNTGKNNRGMHWKNVLKMSPIYLLWSIRSRKESNDSKKTKCSYIQFYVLKNL